MKVFLATQQGQGQRPNDFCHAWERELVRFGMDCDWEAVDGLCGCRRSMVGFRSSKSTTTFKVVEVDMSLDDFLECYRTSLKVDGYGFISEDNMTKYGVELTQLAATFPVNVVLERREQIQVRNIRKGGMNDANKSGCQGSIGSAI